MRLLFLNHNCRYGGTYYRAMPVAEQLAARGHKVTLITVSPSRPLTSQWSIVNGVLLAEMPNWGQRYSGEGYGPIDNVLRLLHTVSHRYDIVHMFDHKPNATFAGLPARLRGAKLVADWADWWGGPGGMNDFPQRHLPWLGHFEAWWEEKSKLWADGVVTISTVLQQRALELGCPRSRVLFVPTGAAVNRIRMISLAEARRSLGVPIDRPIVGFIGLGQGDLETVMEALQRLPQTWLMVIGKANQRVHDEAEAYGIADRLWQTGFVPDEQVSVYLGCANVMCLPLTDRAANRGRLPNKLLDYMCAGRPVVASPIGDVRQIIQTHKIGMLAADAEEFGIMFDTILRDRELQTALGHRARTTAETEFAWPRLIDALEGFYARLLQQ